MQSLPRVSDGQQQSQEEGLGSPDRPGKVRKIRVRYVLVLTYKPLSKQDPISAPLAQSQSWGTNGGVGQEGPSMTMERESISAKLLAANTAPCSPAPADVILQT